MPRSFDPAMRCPCPDCRKKFRRSDGKPINDN